MENESWRQCWRQAVAPLLSRFQLETLSRGLRESDPALIQGSTTCPGPVQRMLEQPCQAACALGYMGWRTGLSTVREVHDFFASLCLQIDLRCDAPAGCRQFLNWFDENPREEVFLQLLSEVEHSLSLLEDSR